MTWSYVRNGLVIAHSLSRLDEGGWTLDIVDFDGFVRTERFDDEPAALRRQMALERTLILHGWGLETFNRAA
ncbi:MAG: hypothetical protein AB7H88_19705 [Vicinamibacterales bacterium]